MGIIPVDLVLCASPVAGRACCGHRVRGITSDALRHGPLRVQPVAGGWGIGDPGSESINEVETGRRFSIPSEVSA